MRFVVPAALAALVPLSLVACDGGSAAGPAGPVTPAEPLAACSYTNPFSSSPECREYTGAGWTEALVRRDCERGWSGELSLGGRCPTEDVLGTCAVAAGTEDALTIVFPGTDTTQCESTRNGCEVFARGTYDGVLCEGGGMPPVTTGNVFQPPTEVCEEPLAGEPTGSGEGGSVCTWNAISGCTEEGRRFADYASCDIVRTQRPYYPVAPADTVPPTPDTRASDPEYMAELDWVTSQVEACACVCCHSSELAPRGASNWLIEAPGIWVDSMGPNGLALAAGWVDSSALGAYPAEENNGFDRSRAGIPTTDADRMIAFFEAELARRGLTREDFRDTRPFGGPIYDQLVYEPGACEPGIGVDAEGRVNWENGSARYVYVLAEGSGNPVVPPNLDLPEGTIWRLDVRYDAAPIESGIAYGSVPEGASQRFPAEGAPAALVSGETYYLYVTADVGVPRTRCLFTAP